MKRMILISAVLAALAAPAMAQDVDTLSPEALLPLAQKEGKVTVYSFTSRIARVEKAFEEAFPGIDLIGFDMSSTEMITRLRTEAAAGIPNADVVYISDAPVVLGELLETGVLKNYVPARVADKLDEAFKSPLLAQRLSTKVLMYNEEAHPDGAPVDTPEEAETFRRGALEVEERFLRAFVPRVGTALATEEAAR